MNNRITIADISSRLADRVESVCSILLPLGKRHGKVLECGSIHGEPGKTLKVNLEGPHRGNWTDWNGSEHKGDLLDLWCACKSIPLPEALKSAKEFLGIHEPALPEKQYKLPKDNLKPVIPTGQAMHWLATQRKIEPRIANLFKIQGDGTAKAIVFPSYSPSGTLINRSWRTITGEKKKVWQDTGAAPSLFGWHALSDEAYRTRSVLICEGQIDAMTWTQWGIPALSIPNGGGATWMEYEWANLESFTTIFLAFDNDVPGQEYTVAALARLGKHRCRLVKFTGKDANEALLAGATAEQAKQWVEKAEYATVSHLVKADHFLAGTVEQFFPTGEALGHTINQTVHDNPEYSFRFRDGELTVWTGVSSHGKSTLLNFAMLQLACKIKRPSLIVTLEMKPAKVIRRIMLAGGGVVTNPSDVAMLMESINSRILFCDKIGKISKEDLFEMMHYAVARYGVANIAIDSLMRVKDLEEDYPAQNEFLTDLVTFSRESNTHIHLVAHPNKSSGNDAPEVHNIKGSGHIRDNADNVLVMWRNFEKEKLLASKEKADRAKATSMPDAKLIVGKDREDGMYREFCLSFEPGTYNYSKWKEPT